MANGLRDVTRNAMARHSLELIYPLALMIYLRFFCAPVIRWLEVDPETLCRFAGLCDKYENKIWDNDIVKTVSDIYAPVKFGLYATGFAIEECNQGFYVDFPCETCLRHELGYWHNKVEVRGNIFDNPELLQEEH